MSIVSETRRDTEERRALLARLLREKRASADPTVHRRFPELFAGQVETVPDAIAIEDGVRALSYRDLGIRAAALARQLEAAAISAGDVVALDVDRSVDIAIAVLALARIGATWLPLEEHDAPARCARQLAAARPVAALSSTERGCCPTPPDLPRIVIARGDAPDTPPSAAIAAPLAFAVVWPGEEPVEITPDAVAARLAAAAGILPLTPGDRVLFTSLLHSEAVTLELLWPLAAGATVVVGPASADPDLFGSLLEDARITAAHVRPSTLIGLAQRAPDTLPQRIVVSGEPIGSAVAKTFAEAGISLKSVVSLPQFAGPVLVHEATCEAAGDVLPLGRPVGPAIRIVDRHGVAVPADVPGILTVDGAPTDLIVRRRRADQTLELITMAGRRRFVDGWLVDPAWIEEAARACPGVAGVFASVRRDTHGCSVLVLHAVPAGPVPPQELVAFLADRLAPWMRPECIVPVSSLPLDGQGHVEEAALARIPVPDDTVLDRWEAALSKDGTEAAVVRVLARPRLGSVRLPVISPRSRDGAGDDAGDPVAGGRPAYAHGGILEIPADAPRTLTQALLRTARRVPDKGLVFVRSDGTEERLSYAELLRRAERIAGGLTARGLKPGDPVILQIADHRRYFPAFWGAVLAGLTPVTIAVSANYAEPGGTVLKLVNAWRLLARPPIVASGEVVAALGGLSAHLDGGVPDVLAAEDLARSPPLTAVHEPRPEDVLFLQLSSGSTGVPKIIRVTHGGVVARIHGDIAVCGDHEDDVDVNWLPLDHVVPLLTCHLKDSYLGCEQVELPTADVIADPLLWLRTMERFRATRSWAPNFGFKLVARALAAAPDAAFDLSSVRHLMNAGEQVTLPVVAEFLSAVAPFGVGPEAMQPAYGMAETCTCVTYETGFRGEASLIRAAKSSLDGVLRVPKPGTRNVATFMRLGPPVPGIEIRIVDKQGSTLQEGVIGRLQIRGPVVTPGYVANDAANAEAFVGDGWFNTGDLGVIVDGNLALTGREKETIVVNGANFYCYEIEDVVNAVDGVEPTFAAATVAPCADTGSEGLAVFFVARDGRDPAEVATAVRRGVAARLGIDPVHVAPLERAAFPKTTSGKIQRTALRRRLDDLQPEATGRTVPAWFYREVWRHRAPPAPTSGRAGTLVLLGGNGPIDSALAESWRSAVQGECLVRPADDAGAILHETPDVAAIVVTGLADCREESLDGIVDCLAHLAALARTLGEHREAVAGRRLVVVSRGALAAGERSLRPAAAALRVAVRSLAQEMPEAQVQLLDLPEGTTPEEDARSISRELCGGSDEAEVALRPAGRFVPRLEAVDPGRNAASPLVRGGRYLITGGLGSLGQALCRFLIDRCDARIVALGRRREDDVETEVAAFGGAVRYMRADVSDRDALARCIEAAEAGFGAFDGVFHLAGLADGRSLADETSETLRSALEAKVGGAVNLDALFHGRPEVPIVGFGSVNAVFGGAGAGAYSAANAVLEALVRRRREAGGRALVVHWSQWRDSGLAERFGLSEFATARGFLPVATEDGLASLMAAMAGDDPAPLIGLDGTNPHIRPRVLGAPDGLDALQAYVVGHTPSTAGRAAVRDRFGTDVRCLVMEIDALPKRDDGAIDRAALAQSCGRVVGRDDSEPQTGTERRLAAIWCELLGRQSVGRGEDFFSVGGHSLVAARLMFRIRREFGRDLPLRALFGAPTVAGMAAAIDGTPEGGPPLPECIVPLQPGGSGTPILCVHPAGGSPLCYMLLAERLGTAQPFYGFQAVGLVDGRQPLPSVEAIAEHYVEAARTILPDAPLRIAAWSSGGPVAFEMARRIEAAGGEVGLLAMFDCGVMESDNPVRGSALLRPFKGLWMIGRYMSQIRWPRSWEELRALARMIGLAVPPRFADVRPNRAFFAALAHSLRLFNLNTAAAVRYRPGAYGGSVVLFRATGSRPRRGDDPTVADLRRYAAGGVEVIEIPGSHMSIILDPAHSAELARAVREVLSRLDQAKSALAARDEGETVTAWEGPDE